jgi:hypothetical protein
MNSDPFSGGKVDRPYDERPDCQALGAVDRDRAVLSWSPTDHQSIVEI